MHAKKKSDKKRKIKNDFSHIQWWPILILYSLIFIVAAGAVTESLTIRFSVAGLLIALGMYFDIVSIILLLAVPPKSGIIVLPPLGYFSSLFVLRKSLVRWQIILLVICAVAFHLLCQIFIPRIVTRIRLARAGQNGSSTAGSDALQGDRIP